MVPEIVTEGVTAQVAGLVAPVGKVVTEQERLTVPVKPFDGVTVIVDMLPVAEPGLTMIAPLLVRAKLPGSNAVPLKAMLCAAYDGDGAFKLLSVSTSEPVRLPGVVGEKFRAYVQVAPGASVSGLSCGHVEPVANGNDGDVIVAGVGNVRAALPTFSTVTVCGLSVLVEPTSVVAKLRLGGSA